MKHERKNIAEKSNEVLGRFMKRFGVMLMALLLCTAVSAQAKHVVSGVVSDSMGEPLPGASVTEKGSMNGTMTGVNGDYTLDVSAGATLVVSFVGHVTQEVAVAGKSTVDITLKEDSRQLEEVVVTALGIKRETKSLGYAIQELKGDALLESRESNVLNSLSGKVAGLQVLRSSNGIGGSTKIVLRGSNSLTGSNQPLIVVDGVPMDNFTGGVDDPYGMNGSDMGSGLGDLNQEDIESMSVLKGASAAALYGSRAGGGVILITTKSGRQRPGLGITVTSGLAIETPFMKPKMQSTFGQGSNNIYGPQNRFSWGPKIDGQAINDWEGKPVNMRSYDNFDAFFETGIASTQGVSFQQDVNGTSVFVSVNRTDDKGTTPKSTLARTGINLRGTTFLDKDKKWQIDAKANYLNQEGRNRPIMGINPANAYNTIYMLPTSLNLKEFKEDTYPDGRMRWWDNATTPQENPYWVVNNRKNRDKRDRLLGTASLKYKATDWLNLEVKAGTDYYTTRWYEQVYAGSPNAKGGGLYNEKKTTFYENNYSFLAVAHKDNLIDRLSGSATFGGNLMYQGTDYLKANSGELLVPNLFSLQNGINPPTVESLLKRKRMNSLYGVLQLSWDNYLYLDITARNDWSSTLSKDNRSYFYPSVSMSYLVTEMLTKFDVKLPEWVTFAKVRGSYAQVGNDLEAHQLYNGYALSKNGFNTNIAKPESVVKYNEDVRSELIKSWEAGLDLRFLNGRIGLDATWYKSNATRQLLEIDLHPFSGYDREKVNAGDIQNQGYEIALNAKILDNVAGGLTWDATVNFSQNKDKIKKLIDGVDKYSLGIYDKLEILAEEGGAYGAIYGQKYLRVTDKTSPHYGKIIVDAQGLPTYENNKYIGNQSPKCMVGFGNNFTYKGFNLSFLVDARIGGDYFSGTTAILHRYGVAAGTVKNGKRDDIVVPNTVMADGSGGYAANATAVSLEKYYERLGAGGNFGMAEEYTYDATNVRLRNVTLGYEFNKKLLAKTPFQRARVSATCNNVWMIHYNLPGIDPETVSATNKNTVGFEGNSGPTSRSFVFNITIGF